MRFMASPPRITYVPSRNSLAISINYYWACLIRLLHRLAARIGTATQDAR